MPDEPDLMPTLELRDGAGKVIELIHDDRVGTSFVCADGNKRVSILRSGKGAERSFSSVEHVDVYPGVQYRVRVEPDAVQIICPHGAHVNAASCRECDGAARLAANITNV